jgi:hypothetical protein
MPLGSRVPRTPTPDVGNLSILKWNYVLSELRPFQSSTELLSILKKGPSKKTSSKITYEEWQLHLMRNIMLDTDLHLRILRYEV